MSINFQTPHRRMMETTACCYQWLCVVAMANIQPFNGATMYTPPVADELFQISLLILSSDAQRLALKQSFMSKHMQNVHRYIIKETCITYSL